MKPLALYVHIPFCDHKCIYCDFYSIINYKDVDAYLTALLKEIKINAVNYNEGREVVSIFFGGGTPSFMNPDYIQEIITCIKRNFSVNEDAEITLETNPGTVTEAKLAEFRKTGINRLSVGIQSFDELELKFLTRIHDSETAIKTVYDAQASGFDNISIDLIFNLPGQSKEIWGKNLETALSLPIQHISAYSLILERGTILNKMVLEGKVKMEGEDFDADLYEFTVNYLLERGFNQYEVSNFAKNNLECIHNNMYWRYNDYLGFGTSAHSFIDGKRWWNYSALNFYIEKLKKNNPVAGSEVLTKEQMHDEYVMLALRSKGLDLDDYLMRFGNDWLKKSETNIKMFLKEDYIVKENNFIKFTPKGYVLCDEIIKNLL